MTANKQMNQMREWVYSDDVSREMRGDYEALEALVGGHPERHEVEISALYHEMKDEID